ALKDSIGKAFEGLFKRTPDSVEIKKVDAKFTASKRSVSSIVFCKFKLKFRVDDGGTERRGRIRFKGPGLLYASPGILHLPGRPLERPGPRHEDPRGEWRLHVVRVARIRKFTRRIKVAKLVMRCIIGA